MKAILITSFLLFSMLFYSFPAQPDRTYQSRLMLMKATFERINDYTATFESYVSNGDKTSSATFKYFFKKPKLVRMEVITGKYSGTTLLYQGSGEVRVKVGMMILGLFTFSYPPEHRYVCDLRGNGLHNSDWGYFIDEHIKMLDLTDGRFIREEKLDKRNAAVYELISKDPSKSRSIAKEQMWIDKDRNILLKYMQYDTEGRLIQSGYYKDIIINKGLDKEIFTNF